ncbi:hypothetical protein V2J09_023288 [Rumex salicifolius]
MASFACREFIMLCVLIVTTSSTAYAFYPSSITNLDEAIINGVSYDSPANSEFSPMASPNVVYVNVDNFIHKSDKGDHTKGLRRAWDTACATKNAVLVVPKGKTYIAKQLSFSGPCVSNLTLQIEGTIQASDNRGDYGEDRLHWIIFKNINGLTVTGGGTLNGKGAIWWKNSCKIDKRLPCKHAPTAVTFYGLKNLAVNELTVKNAQQMHMTIEDCVNVKLSRVEISSPGDSPNTDGIHVTSSQNEMIAYRSIGSLGKNKEKVRVSGIHVNRATLTGTTNGVRIKTWQGGLGYAKDITFQNIVMHNVSNPIIIDQNYCDQNKPCPKSASAVQLRQVTYRNIQGTSKNEEAIKLDCSEKSCRGITLMNVDLVKEGTDHKAKADCNNVKPRMVGNVFPNCS